MNKKIQQDTFPTGPRKMTRAQRAEWNKRWADYIEAQRQTLAALKNRGSSKMGLYQSRV